MRTYGLLALSIAALALPGSALAASDLNLSLTSVQASTLSGGKVDVSIEYSNDGTTSVNNVVVTFNPGALSAVVAADPALADPKVLTWPIGTLTAGQSGTIELEVITGVAPSGSLNLQTSATATGDAANDSLNVPVGASEDPFVSSASYRVKPPNKKGPAGSAQFLIPVELTSDFDGTGPVTITWSNDTQLLAVFDVPGGSMVRNGKGYRVRYLPNPPPFGGEVSLNITKTAAGVHKMRLGGAKMALPVTTSNDIRISIVVDGEGFSAERTFTTKGKVKPTKQQVRYQGDGEGE